MDTLTTLESIQIISNLVFMGFCWVFIRQSIQDSRQLEKTILDLLDIIKRSMDSNRNMSSEYLKIMGSQNDAFKALFLDKDTYDKILVLLNEKRRKDGHQKP